MNERDRFEQAIKALQAQRSILGDSVVDASIAAIREQLAGLERSAAKLEQRKLVTVLFADLVDWTAT